MSVTPKNRDNADEGFFMATTSKRQNRQDWTASAGFPGGYTLGELGKDLPGLGIRPTRHTTCLPILFYS